MSARPRALAAVLHAHFEREEQIALPLLGLLAPLAWGVHAGDARGAPPHRLAARRVPRMLEEHKAIHAATLRLGEAVRGAANAPIARLAEALALHARSEEEVFYPAAVLVGDIVRSRAGQ